MFFFYIFYFFFKVVPEHPLNGQTEADSLYWDDDLYSINLLDKVQHKREGGHHPWDSLHAENVRQLEDGHQLEGGLIMEDHIKTGGLIMEDSYPLEHPQESGLIMEDDHMLASGLPVGDGLVMEDGSRLSEADGHMVEEAGYYLDSEQQLEDSLHMDSHLPPKDGRLLDDGPYLAPIRISAYLTPPDPRPPHVDPPAAAAGYQSINQAEQRGFQTIVQSAQYSKDFAHPKRQQEGFEAANDYDSGTSGEETWQKQQQHPWDSIPDVLGLPVVPPASQRGPQFQILPPDGSDDGYSPETRDRLEIELQDEGPLMVEPTISGGSGEVVRPLMGMLVQPTASFNQPETEFYGETKESSTSPPTPPPTLRWSVATHRPRWSPPTPTGTPPPPLATRWPTKTPWSPPTTLATSPILPTILTPWSPPTLATPPSLSPPEVLPRPATNLSTERSR